MENCLNIYTRIVLRETKCSASSVALATSTSKNTKETIYKIKAHVKLAAGENASPFLTRSSYLVAGSKHINLDLSRGFRACLHTERLHQFNLNPDLS